MDSLYKVADLEFLGLESEREFWIIRGLWTLESQAVIFKISGF